MLFNYDKTSYDLISRHYIGMPESYAHGGGYETRPNPKSPARDLAPKIIDTANALLAR